MKARFLTTLGFFVAPPATIFPFLCSQDKELKVITLEGSGSLFEPIKNLAKKQTTNAIISVLPTGSAGGKESLNEQSSDLALTSLSETTPVKDQRDRKEIQLATDPISLIFKKGSKCQHLNSSNDSQATELPKKLFEESNACNDIILWIREGGQSRSNLNKTTLAEGQTSKIQIKEAPENNFLALEKFLRESYLDSVIFFPNSFYELNKDLFSDYQAIKLQSNGEKSTTTPKLQKELNLVFRSDNIDKEAVLKQFIKNILLETKGLENDFQLTPKIHCCCPDKDSSKCDQPNCQPKDSEVCIENLLKNNNNQK